jgi:hypothetical protein
VIELPLLLANFTAELHLHAPRASPAMLLLLLATRGSANAIAAACNPAVTAAVLVPAAASAQELHVADTAPAAPASFSLPEHDPLTPALTLRAWLLLAWLLPSACKLPQLPNGSPKQPPFAACAGLPWLDASAASKNANFKQWPA